MGLRYKEPVLEPERPAPKTTKGTFTPVDLEPYFTGRFPLPNATVLDPRYGIARLLHQNRAPQRIVVRLDGVPYTAHGLAYLNHGQGGQITGDGIAIVPAPGGQGFADVIEFHLCVHDYVAGAGANPHRGYSPGHCSKCGLDMTVDSSD